MKSKSLESIRGSKFRQSLSFYRQDWVQISCPPSGQSGCGFIWFTAHQKYFTIWSLNNCCLRGENVQFCSQDWIKWFHNNPHFWLGWSRLGLFAWFNCWWPTGLKKKKIIKKIIFQCQIFIFRDNLWIELKKKKDRAHIGPGAVVVLLSRSYLRNCVFILA